LPYSCRGTSASIEGVTDRKGCWVKLSRAPTLGHVRQLDAAAAAEGPLRRAAEGRLYKVPEGGQFFPHCNPEGVTA
jgi:hypothetical protein